MQARNRKTLAWLGCEVKTPPFSESARKEAGMLLGRLQDGLPVGMPTARPMPELGRGCLELRIRDGNLSWRILVRVDADAVVVGGVFPKKTEKTPEQEKRTFRRRLAAWDNA